jgi:Ca-activated chloride channel homolog
MQTPNNKEPAEMQTRESRHPHIKKPSFWSIVIDNIAFATVVILVLLCLQFAASVQAQTPDLARAGELFLTSRQGTVQPALQLQTGVSMQIEGMMNRVSIRQAFSNDTSEWQEGTYVFPLPEDSAVNAMRLLLEEREIVGEIHERAEAQQIYQQARNAGQKAALVEQQRPNMFTQKVANIAPGETVTVELQYIQAVRYENGRFSLRFPMTITPRYIPGSSMDQMGAQGEYAASGDGWARPTTAVPDADKISPSYLPRPLQNAASLDLTLDAGMELGSLRSPSHRLEILESLQQDNLYHMTLEGGTTAMDRDFELEWMPLSGNTPQAATFIDSVDGNTYLQVMLMPPHAQTASAALNREIVIILDTSGSMAGASIVQARQSVEFALSRLQPDDRFNVIEFNSDYQPLFPASVPATPANVAKALNFVRSLDADGGTEMYPVLQWALAADNGNKEELLRQIVFITDGSVGNEEQLFALLRNELGSARLFTVGIGSAPNSHFMRKAAELGRGTYTFISDLAQVTSNMDVLFSKLGNAVMAGVQLDWPAGTEVEAYPAAIPDLYLGEPLFVTAKITGVMPQVFSMEVSGQLQGRDWTRSLNVTRTIPAAEKTALTSAIASYWARQKIAVLSDLLHAGVSMEEVRAQVLTVALPFQLMSRYTSFVAVEKVVARTDEALMSSKLSNQPPAGQLLAAQMAAQNLLAQQLAYPATATPAALYLVAGLLVLFMALCFRMWGRAKLELINYLRVN